MIVRVLRAEPVTSRLGAQGGELAERRLNRLAEVLGCKVRRRAYEADTPQTND